MSLEDDLMRIFGSDKVASIMNRLGMEEGVPIEHSIISKAVENSQKKVEAHNFDMRKHLIEYDDVMNQQRNIVYEYRRQILGEVGLRDMVQEFVGEAAEVLVATHLDEKNGGDEKEAAVIIEAIDKQFGIEGISKDDVMGGGRQAVTEMLISRAWEAYQRKAVEVGPELMPQVERIMTLHTLDNLWKDHLLTMDHLKGGIGLRGYAQQDPLNEYKREGFELFAGMITAFKCDVVERLFKVQIKEADGDEVLEEVDAERPTDERNMVLGRGEEGGGLAVVPSLEDQSDFYAGTEEGGGDDGEAKRAHVPVMRGAPKIGRNEPCPCGSGKKYKKCCGASE